MKLAYIDMCGFRGYSKRIRIDFTDGFTIIDGRNGAGKSTIFDAVEFALTGTLGKYDDAKASGETVADYLWWTGEGPSPSDRYVEVGFRDGDTSISVRRGQIGEPEPSSLDELARHLCDARLAPSEPLSQLCQHAIVRDEYITRLSLDLKETDRYARLRSALGAIDAEVWIARGAELVSLAKTRSKTAQQEVVTANSEVGATARRLDEVRANLVAESTLGDAVNRLHEFTGTVAPPDALAGPTRERMAVVEADIASLQQFAEQWRAAAAERLRIGDLAKTLQDSLTEKAAAADALKALLSAPSTAAPQLFADDAQTLAALVSMGRQLGLRDGHCPLCMKGQSHEEFERGLQIAENLARRINEEAVRAAEREKAIRAAESRFAKASEAVSLTGLAHQRAAAVIGTAEKLKESRGFGADVGDKEIAEQVAASRQRLVEAQRDLRILDTLRLNADLERALRADADSKSRQSRAQERLGRALKTEASAQALHDAARRAASETLDVRLDRVLPLMSELYRRLRPHPMWNDIEYSIRGDVRRFLTLQVGDELNPQFLFSSGQRRATGLAFLLSVNLSLAWSRWRTILLDDPVQHVDDFRTVHLAELCARLVSEGRQIICAVEDAALADLFCRRLPVIEIGMAKRVSLGQDADGAIAIVTDRLLSPVSRSSLAPKPEQAAAG
jgi:chromosome segregation protein